MCCESFNKQITLFCTFGKKAKCLEYRKELFLGNLALPLSIKRLKRGFDVIPSLDDSVIELAQELVECLRIHTRTVFRKDRELQSRDVLGWARLKGHAIIHFDISDEVLPQHVPAVWGRVPVRDRLEFLGA